MCAKMANQSLMRRCDFLNRAAGLKGWEDLSENDQTRYNLEDAYEAQKNRADLLKVTVLSTVDELSDNYSEEELRAQIFAWSSFSKEVEMYDPTSGEEKGYVILNNLKYGQSNRAAEEKLERERPRDVTTGDRTEQKNPEKRAIVVKRRMPVTCGVSEGRRRRKLRPEETRAQKERKRKRNRREVLRMVKKRRKLSNCSSAVVDNVAPFNGRGKSVSKAAVDLARVKLMGEKYDPKANHCNVKADRPIQKLLLSAHIGIKKKSPHLKSCAKLSRDEASAEQQSRQERKKWNSGWRKAAMYEVGVQRKAKPASQAAGTVGKEGLAAKKTDNESGEIVIAS